MTRLSRNELAELKHLASAGDIVAKALLDTSDVVTLFTPATGLSPVAVASHAHGSGASLVGIEDAASVYIGTNVETALAEVKVQANATNTNLASTANGKGASLIGIEDAGTLYTAVNVETALAEVRTKANLAPVATDLASVANGKGASLIGVEDASHVITATTVEGALEEIAVITSNLSSTTISKGASLVGIHDASGIITATTVEGALEEIAGTALAAAPAAALALTTGGNGASLVGIQDALGVITATTVEGALAEIAGSRFRVEVSVAYTEVNSAAKVLLADALVPSGKKARIEGVQVLVGTAWTKTANFTKLTIEDTNGTPVPVCDLLLAGLGASNLLLLTDTTNCVLKAAAVAGGTTASKGLQIAADHNDLLTGTATVVVWGRLL